MRILPWEWSEQPGGAFEKIGVGEFDSCMFFARHGMAGQETLPGARPKDLAARATISAFVLPTSVTSVRAGSEGAEAFDQVENGNDRCCQNDEIAAAHGIGGIRRARFYSPALHSALQNGRAVAPNDPPAR